MYGFQSGAKEGLEAELCEARKAIASLEAHITELRNASSASSASDATIAQLQEVCTSPICALIANHNVW